MDWNARFAVSGPGAPCPPDLVADRLELIPVRGRALDVACGRGTVAVWLARRGLDVDAVDAAPAGLALGRELAAREGVDVTWHQADLDHGLPLGGPYDLVVCQRFRDTALHPLLAAALAPGGLLVITVLSEVDDAPGRFRAPAGELAALVERADLEVLLHREGGGEAGLVARRPAERAPVTGG